jgi:hypothetical protein
MTPSGSDSPTIASILERIVDKQLFELRESGDYLVTPLADVVKTSPIPSDPYKRHYHVTQFVAKDDGATFISFASYLDEEDGGNTYGWFEDRDGGVLAMIEDSEISAVTIEPLSPSTSLRNLPRVVEPAVALSDSAAVNALLQSLVVEYEGKPLDLDTSSDGYFEVYRRETPCALLAGGVLAVCHVEYVLDRWQGTFDAAVQVRNGEIFGVATTRFDGNF